MIKASDLRIGNLVNDDEEIISISFDGRIEVSYDSIEKGNATRYIDIKDCNPIPLTEEWLLKFGFVYGDDDGIITYSMEGVLIFERFKLDLYYELNGYKKAPLEYVHQLQNLVFDLTGEELPLVLR